MKKKIKCPPHHFILNTGNFGVCCKCGIEKQFMKPEEQPKFTHFVKVPEEEKYENNNVSWGGKRWVILS